MKLVPLLFIFFIASCAPMRFENAGSLNTIEQDSYDCQVMLGYRGHAGGNRPTDQLESALLNGRGEMTACLQRKGWKRVS